MSIAQKTVNSTGVYNTFKYASDNALDGYTGELIIMNENLSESVAHDRITETGVYMKRFEVLCSVVSDFFSFEISNTNKIEILFPDEVKIIIKSPSVKVGASIKDNIKNVAGDIFFEYLNAKTSYYDWSNLPYFIRQTQIVTIDDIDVPLYGEDLPLS